MHKPFDPTVQLSSSSNARIRVYSEGGEKAGTQPQISIERRTGLDLFPHDCTIAAFPSMKLQEPITSLSLPPQLERRVCEIGYKNVADVVYLCEHRHAMKEFNVGHLEQLEQRLKALLGNWRHPMVTFFEESSFLRSLFAGLENRTANIFLESFSLGCIFSSMRGRDYPSSVNELYHRSAIENGWRFIRTPEKKELAYQLLKGIAEQLITPWIHSIGSAVALTQVAGWVEHRAESPHLLPALYKLLAQGYGWPMLPWEMFYTTYGPEKIICTAVKKNHPFYQARMLLDQWFVHPGQKWALEFLRRQLSQALAKQWVDVTPHLFSMVIRASGHYCVIQHEGVCMVQRHWP